MATLEGGLGGVVAKHYDNLPEKGKEQRKDSRIFHMRNFNNWIKSTLINEYMEKIKYSQADDYRCKVLDIACGKGGDLLKWQRCGGVGHVIGVDIAATSIEQCKERYADMKGKNRGKLFSGEFYAADCTKDRIRDLYRDPEIQFDLVSCQFAFHYCFESLPQAECMIQNIAENLKKGGFFVGTTPCSNDIMARLQNCGGNSFGNSVFSVTFPQSEGVKPLQPQLFGAQYTFHLEEVVDCPEFLVHFPTFVKLAERYGLMMVGKERFQNYFQKKVKGEEQKKLLNRMNALECYPSHKLVGEENQYDHAQEFQQTSEGGHFGTLSKDEWEALTIYVIFAFKKIR